MRKVLYYIGIVLKFLFFLLLGAAGYLLYKHTLIDWFIPLLVAVCVAVATLTWHRKWKWLIKAEARPLTIICHLLVVTLISYVLFLGSNFLFADKASTHVEQVTVKSKHIEVRKKSRSSGRRHYSSTSTGSTKYYYLLVAFENGKEKELQVKLSVYNTSKVGDIKPLTLREGCFGFPVIMEMRYFDK